jgi:hypothetical protein
MRTSANRYLILLALAATAFVALLFGMPDYLAGVRAAAAGHRVQHQSPWLTAAFVFGFPAWLWSAIVCFRAKQWLWLAVVTLGSYLGILVFAATRVVGARRSEARAA